MIEKFTDITCCVCGVSIWVKPEFQRTLIDTKKLFYCVNGHNQAFTENYEDRLKKIIAEKDRRIKELIESRSKLLNPPKKEIKVENRGRKSNGKNNENYLKIEKLLKS